MEGLFISGIKGADQLQSGKGIDCVIRGEKLGQFMRAQRTHVGAFVRKLAS